MYIPSLPIENSIILFVAQRTHFLPSPSMFLLLSSSSSVTNRDNARRRRDLSKHPILFNLIDAPSDPRLSWIPLAGTSLFYPKIPFVERRETTLIFRRDEIQPRRTMIRYVGQFTEQIARRIRGRLLRILSRSVDSLNSISLSLSLRVIHSRTPVENRSLGSISVNSKGKDCLKNGWNRVFTRVS